MCVPGLGTLFCRNLGDFKLERFRHFASERPFDHSAAISDSSSSAALWMERVTNLSGCTGKQDSSPSRCRCQCSPRSRRAITGPPRVPATTEYQHVSLNKKRVSDMVPREDIRHSSCAPNFRNTLIARSRRRGPEGMIDRKTARSLR